MRYSTRQLHCERDETTHGVTEGIVAGHCRKPSTEPKYLSPNLREDLVEGDPDRQIEEDRHRHWYRGTVRQSHWGLSTLVLGSAVSSQKLRRERVQKGTGLGWMMRGGGKRRALQRTRGIGKRSQAVQPFLGLVPNAERREDEASGGGRRRNQASDGRHPV
jgi:hypothetical protein